MGKKTKWAFILDKDEFVRFSLNKILQKYGFETEEIETLSRLEGRKKDIEAGMILADMDVEELERWSLMMRKWNDRLILMTPLVTDELTQRLKKTGIRHILKKPVEPKLLKRVVRGISFPDGEPPPPGKKKRKKGSGMKLKGGEHG
jgi:FixJ family two-component response regulator